jgi:hypothetical protein
MQLYSYLILIIKTLSIKLKFLLHASVDLAIIEKTFFGLTATMCYYFFA